MKRKFETEIYFTPKQAAEHFNLSLSTVKNYIYDGKLRTLKTPGGHHRIRKSDLMLTMGDIEVFSSRPDDFFSLMQTSCEALLATFKPLGNAGYLLAAHAEMVSKMSYKLARSMGLSDNDAKMIRMAGLVHDIGQAGIEEALIKKPSPLSAEEYELLKGHAAKGQKILSAINFLNEIAVIVGQHHERLDGKGYPNGLRDGEIYKAARIIAVTEAYDSMVSRHSYKKPVSKDEAISELLRCSGPQFDADIVKAFIETL